jgi:RimJ/RimL family protein N-acetyltransferase
MSITFEKATLEHEKLIFEWLEEPHMIEFWDNSQEHKDDILNFIYGRKQTYFCGTTKYWIGCIDLEPFAFILSDQLLTEQTDLPDIYLKYMSKTNHNISLDFGIGNKDYLGQGLAAPTLVEFMEFYKNEIDPKATTYFIDPDLNNPRAKHVYEKAGFELVGDYDPELGAFVGQKSYLLVKNI